MGKIIGKYHILDIFSYSFSIEEVQEFLHEVSPKFRGILIENFRFIHSTHSGFISEKNLINSFYKR